MRKLARGVARANMKMKGMVQLCKHSRNRRNRKNRSFFSLHWREYVW